jgi:hypothetical protein
MLTLVKLTDERDVDRQIQEREAEVQAKREAEADRRTEEARALMAIAEAGSVDGQPKSGVRQNEAYQAPRDNGGAVPGQNGGQPRRERTLGGSGNEPRRGYGGFVGEQPSWRQTWHQVSRPSVRTSGGNSERERRMSYVDRFAPDIHITPDEVRSVTRVKMRRMLKEAQVAGALDEVEMLQMQIAELDRMS